MEKSARTIEFTDEEQKSCQRSLPLTTKPVLYVANVDEDVVSDPDSIEYVTNSRICSDRKCRGSSYFRAC